MATRITVKLTNAAKKEILSSRKAQDYIDNKANEVKRAYERNVPSSSGELKSSVRVRAEGTGRKIVVDSTHASAVETGTGPRHETLDGQSAPRPQYWPAQNSSLREWAERNTPQLLKFDSLGNTNLFLVSRAIYNNGTPAFHPMLHALQEIFPRATGRYGVRER